MKMRKLHSAKKSQDRMKAFTMVSKCTTNGRQQAGIEDIWLYG